MDVSEQERVFERISETWRGFFLIFGGLEGSENGTIAAKDPFIAAAINFYESISA